MVSRRAFLRRTSMISLSPLVPSVLGRVASAAATEPDARALVVIQLDGGNDGINTVVPFADDAYGRHRKELRLDAESLHKLNDQVGLHPQMKAAKRLFDEGRLTIVQGVGYPNPNRSHFESMRIWHTARLDAANTSDYGWLGRALDSQGQNTAGQAGAVYVGAEQVPVALWGRRSEAATITRLEDLTLPFSAKQMIPTTLTSSAATTSAENLSLFTTRQVLSAYASADQLEQTLKVPRAKSATRFPNTQLGSQLKIVSQLIQSGSAARVFYASQSGYDTHSTQLYTHANLLQTFAEALKAFLDDLKSHGLEERVVVLAFSEFGRRVTENDSQGTDHGTAGPVFLAGGKAKGGLIGDAPNLADLDHGDIKTTIDLRGVYASILDDWLGLDSAAILGDPFAKTDVIRQ